jgi:integrase
MVLFTPFRATRQSQPWLPPVHPQVFRRLGSRFLILLLIVVLAPRLTLADAVAHCLDAKTRANRRHVYIKKLRSAFLQFSHGRAPRMLDMIPAPEIESWMRNAKWTALTQRSKLTDLNVLFAWAVRRGHLVTNPCSRIEPPAVDWIAPLILTVEDCAALMKAATATDPGMTRYFALALFLGIRPGEIMRLTNADIDLANGYVRIEAAASKVRARRLVATSATSGYLSGCSIRSMSRSTSRPGQYKCVW